MGRAILILGILLTIAGIGGMVYGMIAMTGQVAGTIQTATSPNAAELCRPDETLEEATGASEYSPTSGWGRQVSYFCVNSKGERREVTGQFVGGMFEQVFGSFGGFALPMIGGGVMTVGILLTVVGAIFGRRRPSPFADIQYPAMSPSEGYGAWSSPPNANLTERLRQVEAARQAGLISYEEYKRLRQEILDAMQ